MQIINLFPGSYNSNCYILVHNGQALVIDPSASAKAILERVQKEGAELTGILLTHGHFDHILSLDTLRDATGAPAYLHPADHSLLGDGQKNAFSLFFGQDRVWRPAEREACEGDTIPLGNASVAVLHTPGHTAGSVCYLAGGTLLTGDTLFSDTFGRYDLYSGDLDALKASLRRLSTLDGSLTICPGHNESAPLSRACTVVSRMLRL